MMYEHLRDAQFQKQPDRSFKMVLKSPCITVDERKFKLEAQYAFLKLLMLAGKGEDIDEVVWTHNGVPCTTKWKQMPGGPWGHFTEANSVQAN